MRENQERTQKTNGPLENKKYILMQNSKHLCIDYYSTLFHKQAIKFSSLVCVEKFWKISYLIKLMWLLKPLLRLRAGIWSNQSTGWSGSAILQRQKMLLLARISLHVIFLIELYSYTK